MSAGDRACDRRFTAHVKPHDLGGNFFHRDMMLRQIIDEERPAVHAMFFKNGFERRPLGSLIGVNRRVNTHSGKLLGSLFTPLISQGS
ncbi:MAG: hypothetical protein AAFZ11_00445 [Pseudomonadota bacterium]